MLMWGLKKMEGKPMKEIPQMENLLARLFTLPPPMSMGVLVINPMSTVSPTVGRRHWRRMDGDREERKTRRR
jgi:hypothetical protein